MDVKEYLEQIRKIDIWLEAKEEELLRLDNERYKITSSLNESGVFAGGGTAARFEKLTDEIIDMQEEISRQARRKQAVRRDICETINKVEDITLQTLLTYRYVIGSSWEEIAKKMYYGERQVFYLHNKGLGEVGRVIGLGADKY